MASFYNNYYRYYRPYSSANFKNSPDTSNHYPDEDKSNCQHDSRKEASTQTSSKEEKSSRYYSFGPINFKNPLFSDIEEPVFEILGIELYLDDIIILGLLFFLYQEGVQDQILFITLIMLLLG